MTAQRQYLVISFASDNLCWLRSFKWQWNCHWKKTWTHERIIKHFQGQIRQIRTVKTNSEVEKQLPSASLLLEAISAYSWSALTPTDGLKWGKPSSSLRSELAKQTCSLSVSCSCQNQTVYKSLRIRLSLDNINTKKTVSRPMRCCFYPASGLVSWYS